MRTGVAFRPELADWLLRRSGDIGCLELTVDHVLTGRAASARVRERSWPFVLRAPQVCLEPHRPVDAAALRRALQAACTVDPVWISVHLGCQSRPEAELSYPQAFSPTRSILGQVIASCRQVIDACGRPLLVENVAAFGGRDVSMPEAEFINQLCDETGCQLLLDVTALALDARFGFDPHRWLWDVEPRHVAAIRVGGWAPRPTGRWSGRREGPVSAEVWTLAREVVARTPVQATILQSDGASTDADRLDAELRRAVTLGTEILPPGCVELDRADRAIHF
jgi:uncharacterized protein (UPF0276 family)